MTTFHGSLVPLKRTPNGFDSLSRTTTRRNSFSAVLALAFLSFSEIFLLAASNAYDSDFSVWSTG